MKRIEAWQCGFCNKTTLNAGAMKSHEGACKNNPDRRHCITCIHGVYIDPVEVFKPLTVQSYMPGFDNAPDIYVGPWCDHHRMPIHEKPYFVDCDSDDLPRGGEVYRPGTCFNYEYKGYAKWDRRDETEAIT